MVAFTQCVVNDTFANMRALHFLYSSTTDFTTHIFQPHSLSRFKAFPKKSSNFSQPLQGPSPHTHTQHHSPNSFFPLALLLSIFGIFSLITAPQQHRF